MNNQNKRLNKKVMRMDKKIKKSQHEETQKSCWKSMPLGKGSSAQNCIVTILNFYKIKLLYLSLFT